MRLNESLYCIDFDGILKFAVYTGEMISDCIAGARSDRLIFNHSLEFFFARDSAIAFSKPQKKQNDWFCVTFLHV